MGAPERLIQKMTRHASDSEMRQTSRSLARATILIFSVLVCYLPFVYGRAILVHDGRSQNDLAYCILLPLLSAALMAACVPALRAASFGGAAYRMRWVGGAMWRGIVWGVILFIIAFLVAALLVQVRTMLQIPRTGRTLLSVEQWSTPFTLLYVLHLTVVTPLIEEIFWRAHIQGSLSGLFGARVGILLQALVFAGVHLYGFMDAVMIFQLAVILGVWRHRKNTLVPLIVAHGIWNLVSLIPLLHVQSLLRQTVH
jgi:membrane protease YdiL (CAAX protease family)